VYSPVPCGFIYRTECFKAVAARSSFRVER
jgi:hypothetical protein